MRILSDFSLHKAGWGCGDLRGEIALLTGLVRQIPTSCPEPPALQPRPATLGPYLVLHDLIPHSGQIPFGEEKAHIAHTRLTGTVMVAWGASW